MTATAHPAAYPYLGAVTVGTTTYMVFDLPVGPSARADGIEHNLELVGPRGARYFVVDHGPDYSMTCISTSGSLHNGLRDLTRAHLAPFGVRLRE